MPTFDPGPVLTVGAFVALAVLAVLAFIAQGLTGTPLVARYLLLPALACAPLAATLIHHAEGLHLRGAVRVTLTWTMATVLVATTAASNLTAWHDLSSARATRQDLFTAADDLLHTDLARACPGVFVVRSPAMIPIVALSLGRPLEDLRVAGDAAGGVLLQPLTIDAAALAGYGPLTPLEDQGRFPTDASPRTANTHWALYSNCATTGRP